MAVGVIEGGVEVQVAFAGEGFAVDYAEGARHYVLADVDWLFEVQGLMLEGGWSIVNRGWIYA